LKAFIAAGGLYINSGMELGFGGNEDVQVAYTATAFTINTKSRYGGGTVNTIVPFGNVIISNNLTIVGVSYIKLPTSAAGLPSGTLWNNGGTVTIVP